MPHDSDLANATRLSFESGSAGPAAQVNRAWPTRGQSAQGPAIAERPQHPGLSREPFREPFREQPEPASLGLRESPARERSGLGWPEPSLVRWLVRAPGRRVRLRGGATETLSHPAG